MASEQTGASFDKLSIFYPMWNEEEYVDRALTAARRACVALIEAGDIADYELIIVNDASTDRTAEIADAIAAADPHVTVIHHAKNRKLGGATSFCTPTPTCPSTWRSCRGQCA
jgi:glycosyltransferase involved in cell wall biosynthesis